MKSTNQVQIRFETGYLHDLIIILYRNIYCVCVCVRSLRGFQIVLTRDYHYFLLILPMIFNIFMNINITHTHTHTHIL